MGTENDVYDICKLTTSSIKLIAGRFYFVFSMLRPYLGIHIILNDTEQIQNYFLRELNTIEAHNFKV